MPDIAANAFPIAFADFRRAYVIVDRRGTVVVRDNLTAKPYVKFWTTRRIRRRHSELRGDQAHEDLDLIVGAFIA